MPDPSEIAQAVADAPDWNARVGLIRTIPEQFGTSLHARVYAAVAERVYVPSLKADFAYVHWRDEYELPVIRSAYDLAKRATNGFRRVDQESLAHAIVEYPETLRIFRLLLGLTIQEFAEACAIMSAGHELVKVAKSSINTMESGGPARAEAARTCAVVIDRFMRRELFPPIPGESELRSKLDKPDTARGWNSVRQFAKQGVPLPVLLHQRAYGGAFRQLLDATSSARGDLLEDPVEALFAEGGIPYIRTGSSDQNAAAARFG